MGPTEELALSILALDSYELKLNFEIIPTMQVMILCLSSAHLANTGLLMRHIIASLLEVCMLENSNNLSRLTISKYRQICQRYIYSL